MATFLSEQWLVQSEARTSSVFRGPAHFGGSLPKAGKIERNCLTHLKPCFLFQAEDGIRDVQHTNGNFGAVTAASDSGKIHLVAVALSPSSFEQPLHLHSRPPVQPEARRQACRRASGTQTPV